MNDCPRGKRPGSTQEFLLSISAGMKIYPGWISTLTFFKDSCDAD
jgi:hypothetical protein